VAAAAVRKDGCRSRTHPAWMTADSGAAKSLLPKQARQKPTRSASSGRDCAAVSEANCKQARQDLNLQPPVLEASRPRPPKTDSRNLKRAEVFTRTGGGGAVQGLARKLRATHSPAQGC